LARLLILLVAGGMAWYTWGHWGDFQVDCGREIYVPAALLRGKLLFRDVWYMYGPLAPYAEALLFRIFGIHFTVLYLFGLTLTVGSALLTFEIARQFHLGIPVSLVPALFFLAESYYPFIFNFVFPYSYAASLGSFLGSACLYLVLRYVGDRGKLSLGAAAVLAGLVALTKQEFGLACIVVLFIGIVASYFTDHSKQQLIRNCGLCLAGLLPAIAVYMWFVSKVSAPVLLFENWISTPGTYFMRVWARHTMPEQGFRFSAGEITGGLEFALLAIALWSTIASFDVIIIKKFNLRSPASFGLLVFGNLVPVAVILNQAWAISLVVGPITRTIPVGRTYMAGVFTAVREIVEQMVLPKGLFLFALFFLIYSAWRFFKRGMDVRAVVLATYGVLVSLRIMWELRPSPYKYSVFFNVPSFLIFVILLNRAIRWAARSLEARRRQMLAVSLLSVELLVIFVMLFPNPQSLPAPLTTNYGTLYTKHDVSVLFPQIISFMRTHTKNGRDILVLPEPPSLYVFAGMESPSKWYSLLPGILPPEKESEYLQELASNGVRYILIGNRAMPEYGPVHFGYGYNEGVSRWIKENFVNVGRFGPLLNEPFPPYIVWIYERKDLPLPLDMAQLYPSYLPGESVSATDAYGSR
jgi:hypothetical protein